MHVNRDPGGQVTSVKVSGYVDEIIQAKAFLMREQGQRPFAVLLSPEMYEQLYYRVRDFIITRRDSGLAMYIGLLVIVGDVDGIQVVTTPHEAALRRVDPDSILRGAKT